MGAMVPSSKGALSSGAVAMTTLALCILTVTINVRGIEGQVCCNKCPIDSTCQMFGNSRCRCVKGGAILDEIHNVTTAATYDVDVALDLETATEVTDADPGSAGYIPRGSAKLILIFAACVILTFNINHQYEPNKTI